MAPVTPATSPAAATAGTSSPAYSTPSQTPGSNVTTIPAPITPAPKSASSTRLLSGAVIALIVLFVLGGTGVIFTMWQIAAPSKRE